MTLKVPRSQIEGTDFAALVAEHVVALQAHASHMAIVRSQADRPAEERTHEAYPPPSPHPLVDAAVRRVEGGGFAADYVVEDDGPTPEEVFVRKKAELMGAVGAAETAAKAAVMPAGKVRLHAILVADAGAKKKGRTTEERAALELDEVVTKKFDAINRHGAVLHSEVEDLTAETVDGWKMKEFPR